MKFTLSWLKEHLQTDANLKEITDKLTSIGLEVESVSDKSVELAGFIVAQIVNAKPHPDANKLQICTVDDGSEKLQIICGASNARAGIKVVMAPVGVTIPGNGLVIKKAKIRGVESNGMLCSAEELALGKDSNGIIELPQNLEIGKSFAEQAGLNDPVIQVNITPNRGDCLGVKGIARDLAASGIGTLRNTEIPSIAGKFKSPINVTINNPEKTPCYIGRYFKNLKNPESPEWLKKKLESIGLRPISALVDITNFLTFDLGRPAHIYDADKLNGDIVARNSTDNEKISALDNKEYLLNNGFPVIADNKKVVAIGGIIGETDSGCSAETKNAFLEIAYFNPISIAEAGRKLQINSDARYRFERGVDPAFLKNAAEIATKLIIDICGGEPSKLVYAGTEPTQKKSINFNPDEIKSLTGIEISIENIYSILQILGFNISSNESCFSVTPPSWRKDIEIGQDITEEIARIYGYDKIPATSLPQISGNKNPLNHFQNSIFNIRKTLANRGMKEITSFSFMSSKAAALFGNDGMRLENPISAELDVMRPSILPNLLDAAHRNATRGYNNIALFEVAPIFNSTIPGNQKICASGIRSGDNHSKNYYHETRKIDIFDAKSDALAALSLYVPTGNISVTRDAPEWYHPGRSGALLLGKKILGYFGEIHPAVLKKMDIETIVAGFEIFPQEAPIPRESGTKSKLVLNNFQNAERDFAFILNENILASDLLKTVRQAEKELIKEANIFDVYQGKNIPEGKKSIAVSVTLQSSDHTLSDGEIEETCNKIIANVQKLLGAEIRDK